MCSSIKLYPAFKFMWGLLTLFVNKNSDVLNNSIINKVDFNFNESKPTVLVYFLE